MPRQHTGDEFTAFEDLSVREISQDTARDLCLQRHYAHRWSRSMGRINYGVFRHGCLLGCAVYGCPRNVGANATIADVDPASMVELNRLWIDDELGRNTESWFLAQTFKRIRRDHHIRLVQSFADGRLGVGTIYQAANFGYYGQGQTRFHRHRRTGETFHDGPFTNTACPTYMIGRNRMHVDGLLETFTVNTYRYLKPLDRDAARRIRLQPLPYPKGRVGEVLEPDYQPPLQQIARCVALCRAGRRPDEHVFRDYLHSRTADADTLIADACTNEWVKGYGGRFDGMDSLLDLIVT